MPLAERHLGLRKAPLGKRGLPPRSEPMGYDKSQEPVIPPRPAMAADRLVSLDGQSLRAHRRWLRMNSGSATLLQVDVPCRAQTIHPQRERWLLQ